MLQRQPARNSEHPASFRCKFHQSCNLTPVHLVIFFSPLFRKFLRRQSCRANRRFLSDTSSAKGSEYLLAVTRTGVSTATPERCIIFRSARERFAHLSRALPAPRSSDSLDRTLAPSGNKFFTFAMSFRFQRELDGRRVARRRSASGHLMAPPLGALDARSPLRGFVSSLRRLSSCVLVSVSGFGSGFAGCC